MQEKNKKMEESIPAQAIARYRKVIEDFRSRLGENPDLELREYCKETHTNYRGLIDWMERNGINTCETRRKARAKENDETTVLESEGAFIQFVPSGKSTSGNLRGVSITFPDGVHLTLQESSVESLISLLNIYTSRLGGAKLCSD